MNPYDILQERVFSERTTVMQESDNRYTFRVHSDANKIQIKSAVEQAFSVKVLKVNTQWVRGKRRRFGAQFGSTAAWKKAIVTIPQDQQIQLS